jgi:adenylosuccinate synthase
MFPLSENGGIVMPCSCVVGLQWGDEAKGKIVDLLTEGHDFVVRYNGGANAGHTVVWEGRTFKLSLLPTGVLRSSVKSVIANGVVIYPPRFQEEVTNLRQAGITIGDNLVVSNHAHVIFPYHMEEERLVEVTASGSGSAIGTTGRGIGPCYEDKAGRLFSVRVEDLLHPDHFRGRLEKIVDHKNRMLRGLSAQAAQFDVGRLFDEYVAHGQMLRRYVTDTTSLLVGSVRQGKHLLFEAAQGSLLDVDHGSYPYVTSSNSSVAGVWAGSGVPTRNLQRVIGVIKAYTTRVGGGPFPTELNDGPSGIGERIRRVGREYGTVTGRPRRTGWFDAVAVKHTASFNGADELALMLLDVLSDLDELKVCVAYELDGDRIATFPGDSFLLTRCKPAYETIPGWKQDISGVRRLGDLPAAARRYIDRLSEAIELPVSIVSVGPDRAQTIFVR